MHGQQNTMTKTSVFLAERVAGLEKTWGSFTEILYKFISSLYVLHVSPIAISLIASSKLWNLGGGREGVHNLPLSLTVFRKFRSVISSHLTKKLCRILKFPLLATCSAHLTFVYLIILIMSLSGTAYAAPQCAGLCDVRCIFPLRARYYSVCSYFKFISFL